MFVIHISANSGDGDMEKSVISPGDTPSEIRSAASLALAEMGAIGPDDGVLEFQGFEGGRSSIRFGRPGAGEFECLVAYVSAEPVLVSQGRMFSLVERII